MRLTSYLNFRGDCARALAYYEQLFGGTIELMMTHGESPTADQVPASWHPYVMHARLAIGDQMLLASDVPPDEHEPPQGVWVSLDVEAPAEAARIFRGLSAGGRLTMPWQRTFWAPGGFGMCHDRFGIPWIVNCESVA